MVKAAAKGPVAAIGNFDGVHRGHQRLLARAAGLARKEHAPLAVVVFDPHPRRFFRPDDPAFLLTTLKRRRKILLDRGVNDVIALTFDAELASMTPEAFVVEVLKERLRLSGVVTGSEFRFGKGRAGDAESLTRLCEAAGLAVLIVEPAKEGAGGGKIGSSAIRTAIKDGDVRAAAEMLGRPWSVNGIVERGQQIGRTIGFPTANMTLGDLIEPRRGVYAVEALIDGEIVPGVANFGRRPTVAGAAPLLEAHLFDFDADLYGRMLDVAFIEFIRDERKFDGLDSLKAQIAADCQAARHLLSIAR